MSMGVIVIYNDINEIVGIAKDYESAINFLLDNHFLDSEFEIMDEEYRWTPLKDLNISINDRDILDKIHLISKTRGEDIVCWQ